MGRKQGGRHKSQRWGGRSPGFEEALRWDQALAGSPSLPEPRERVALQPRDRTWRRSRLQERGILVGVVLPHRRRSQEEQNLQELAQLARTAGAEPAGQVIQERSEPDVRTYVGRGKVDEIRTLCEERNANLVIFDETLSPAQARNLEKLLERNVIDRPELILDIFARHARSREAMLQVELAQLEYMRPRLRRLWDHLSRQDGGIGTRGPGETQLEVDRRRVEERISSLKRQLRERQRVASTQRRSRRGEFRVALVGYTNAGKSSLMNALAGSELLVENQLFSTLDATTRRTNLGGRAQVLLTDTVGFIRKLPHDLVASFESTLSEIHEADLLLHVADVTSHSLPAHIDTVHEVLQNILPSPRDTIMVFNKMDALEDRTLVNVMLRHHPRAHFVSARSGEGLPELRMMIQGQLRARMVEAEIEVLGHAADVVSFCYREGHVQGQDLGSEGRVRLRVTFQSAAFQRLAKLHRGDFRIVRTVARHDSEAAGPDPDPVDKEPR